MLQLHKCYTSINIPIQIHLKSESCRLINLIYINNTMPYVAKKAFCYKIARLNALLLLLEKNVSEFHRLYASLIYFVVVILWFVSPKLNCRVYFTISMPSLSWVRLPQPPQVFISLGDPLPALLITALRHCSSITSWNAITSCITENPSAQRRKKGIFISLLRSPQNSLLRYKIPETPPFFFGYAPREK